MANETPEMKRVMLDVAACMAALAGQDTMGTPVLNEHSFSHKRRTLGGMRAPGQVAGMRKIRGVA